MVRSCIALATAPLLLASALAASAPGDDRTSCSFYGGRSGKESAPFDFFRILDNGSKVAVSPEEDASGVCIYPGATCGGEQQCCSTSAWAAGAYGTASTLNAIGGGALLLGFIAVQRQWAGRRATAHAARAPQEAGGSASQAAPKSKSCAWAALQQLSVDFGLAAQISASIWIADGTQAALTVTERNSMLAADAILTPIKEVFQFLEDSVSVKVCSAIGLARSGRGSTEAVSAILMLGLVGGLATGTLAALVATAISFWPSWLAALLAPGADAHKAAAPGCGLLPGAAGIVEGARSFWLMSVWTWPLVFMCMILTGFMLATRQLLCFGLAMVASQATLLLIWARQTPQNLHTLGSAGLAAWAVLLGVYLANLLLNEPLRMQWGLRLGVIAKALEPSSADNSKAGSKRQLLSEGLQCMLVDLSTQLSITIGVYVAAFMGTAQLYQISAMQAAMPGFATAYAFGVGYVLKLRGAQILGAGDYDGFRQLCLMASFVALGLVAVPVVVTFRGPDSYGLAFNFGQNACVFAASRQCVPIYEGVFGSDASVGTLQHSFSAFALAAASKCFYLMSRAALYSCLDFRFMAHASVAVFLAVFVPAIFVARFSFNSVVAVFLAMYMPTLVLAIVFAARLVYNLKMMSRGEKGPWSEAVRSADMADEEGGASGIPNSSPLQEEAVAESGPA